jgi:prepilin-type N-terminal cleavage/methylation domain-containing protein
LGFRVYCLEFEKDEERVDFVEFPAIMTLMKRRNCGFTLVEMMLVVAIIALLASMAIPNLLRARIVANDAAAQAALKAISTAMETYMTNNRVYPPDTVTLVTSSPAYLITDYFTGAHNGFTFTATLTDQSYSVTAVPISANHGSTSYTVSTGGVLVAN